MHMIVLALLAAAAGPENKPLLFYSLEIDPGKPQPATSFHDLSVPLGDDWGFNAWNAQNVVQAATFDAITNGSAFPAGSAARAWSDMYSSLKADEIAAAQLAQPGVDLIFETDMLVLPASVVEMYRDTVVDPSTGRLSLDMPGTLPLIKAMLDETVARFPQLAGFQIRVGEVNVDDFPYHVGVQAVDFSLPFAAQQAQYVKLISFLREVVCVKHGRTLIFRTWDTAGFGGAPDEPTPSPLRSSSLLNPPSSHGRPARRPAPLPRRPGLLPRRHRRSGAAQQAVLLAQAHAARLLAVRALQPVPRARRARAGHRSRVRARVRGQGSASQLYWPDGARGVP